MDNTEYISKEAALACFSDWIDRYGHEHTADEMVEYQRIEDLPVVDVVEVVRCQYCVHNGDISCPWDSYHSNTPWNDYCSWGERRVATTGTSFASHDRPYDGKEGDDKVDT